MSSFVLENTKYFISINFIAIASHCSITQDYCCFYKSTEHGVAAMCDITQGHKKVSPSADCVMGSNKGHIGTSGIL